MEWRERDGVRWLEAELGMATTGRSERLNVAQPRPADARAAFTSRLAGISRAPYDSLNLGVLTGDQREAVVENRLRLAAALAIDPGRVVMGRQVHGAEIAAHQGPQDPPHFETPGEHPPSEHDGHTTAEDDLALLVLVADCVPIALSGPGGVAMLHAGWRGMAAGIVGKGAVAIAATHAAIGPSIGPCCFEVGEEVAAAFAPLGPSVSTDPRRVDLRAVATALLGRAGVGEIEVSDLCTRCNPDLFFSHRGQGPETGRQAGLVWRTAGG